MACRPRRSRGLPRLATRWTTEASSSFAKFAEPSVAFSRGSPNWDTIGRASMPCCHQPHQHGCHCHGGGPEDAGDWTPNPATEAEQCALSDRAAGSLASAATREPRTRLLPSAGASAGSAHPATTAGSVDPYATVGFDMGMGDDATFADRPPSLARTLPTATPNPSSATSAASGGRPARAAAPGTAGASEQQPRSTGSRPRTATGRRPTRAAAPTASARAPPAAVRPSTAAPADATSAAAPAPVPVPAPAAQAGTSTTTRRKTTSAQRRAQRKADAVKFALSPEQRAARERRSESERLRRDSRWFSNTKFGRLFSKPPFGMYGNGNRRPTDGGVFDGGYMSSHNIMPLMHPANPKAEVGPPCLLAWPNRVLTAVSAWAQSRCALAR